jgi:methionyl-tRNA formyltransferase
MRIAFMGSPGFAVPALERLVQRHEVVAVYCQKPRPAGRGQAIRRCAVHEAAARLGLVVRYPERLRGDGLAQEAFAALRLDAAVVAAYGLILPPAMLAAPARGCINIHASLLPRWRGAAPIQAAILAGDAATGVTTMQMEAGLDTGPMLLQQAVPITATTTAGELHDVLAEVGAGLIVRTLDEDPPAVAQPEGATYAAKLSRDDGVIDWRDDAVRIDRQIRALNPWPGTVTTLDGAVLKVLAAALIDYSGEAAAGTALDDALTVACGRGALRLVRVQLPGRAPLAAGDFLRGHPVKPGTRLG